MHLLKFLHFCCSGFVRFHMIEPYDKYANVYVVNMAFECTEIFSLFIFRLRIMNQEKYAAILHISA